MGTAQGVWCFLEGDGRRLHKAAGKVAGEALGVGKSMGEAVGAVAIGADLEALAAEIGQCGIARADALCPPRLQHLGPEETAFAIANWARRRHPKLLLFGATAVGSDIAARVAAELEAGLITRCIEFALESGTVVARKAVLEGKAHAVMEWCQPPPHLATVDLEALEAPAPGSGERRCQVENFPVEEARPRAAFVNRWRADPRELDLAEGAVVVGVGRPLIAKPEALSVLKRAAEALGAVFGVSRPVADAGLVGKERQIGASGRWLGAEVYIACGVSGSTYHMLGVKKVRHLIAVNTDPEAPIMKAAELAVVGDLFAVLPELERLAAEGSSNARSSEGNGTDAASQTSQEESRSAGGRC